MKLDCWHKSCIKGIRVFKNLCYVKLQSSRRFVASSTGPHHRQQQRSRSCNLLEGAGVWWPAAPCLVTKQSVVDSVELRHWTLTRRLLQYRLRPRRRRRLRQRSSPSLFPPSGILTETAAARRPESGPRRTACCGASTETKSVRARSCPV